MRLGEGQKPSLTARALYASLMVPMQIAWGPLLSTIPALYAVYGTISLRRIGTVMLLLRLLDVLVDPMIGLLSDRTRSRWGRRKPWLLAGTVLVLPFAWALFAVPRNAGLVYFGVSMGLVYLGWSMVEIPHTAWLGELSHDGPGRAGLSGWRTAAASAGVLLYMAIPLLPRFTDAAMTPAVLGVARRMLLVLLPPALLLTLLLLPAGSFAGNVRPGLGSSIRALASSGSMRILSVVLLFDSIGSGMCAACYFFYLSTYLGIAGSFGTIGVAAQLMELLSGLASPWLIATIGKRACLAFSSGSSLVALIGMALIRRGTGASLAVIALFAVTSLTATCGDVAVPVMAAEAANAKERRAGGDELGNFMAATVLCRKIGVALGGGAAFLLLGTFGFDPKMANGTRAMAGFDLTLFGVPGLLYLAATVAAMRIPIHNLPEAQGRAGAV